MSDRREYEENLILGILDILKVAEDESVGGLGENRLSKPPYRTTAKDGRVVQCRATLYEHELTMIRNRLGKLMETS